MKNVLRFRVAACIVFFLCIATATVVSAQTFTTLVSFDGTASGNPQAPPAQAVDGNLYGTNYGAGGFPLGSLFKITPAGALTTEYLFGPGDSGAEPQAGMILANDGSLYGTTTYLGANGWGTAFQSSSKPTLSPRFTIDAGLWPVSG